MAIHGNVGDLDIRAVSRACKSGNGFRATLDHVFGVAFNKDFANEVGLGKFGTGREIGRVVSFRQREMLLSNNSSGDTLFRLA